MTRAIAARTEAVALRRTLGDSRKVSENLVGLLTSLVGAGRDAEAEAASREAIELVEALPPCRERALAYRAQAALRMLQRDNAEAVAWARKALALNETIGDVDTAISALNTIGSALIVAGHEDEGRAYLDDALARARAAQSEPQIVNALGNLGSALGERYRFEAADPYLEACVAFCTERDIDFSRLYALAWRSISLLHRGRWNDAGDTALKVLHAEAPMISRTMALVALGRLRARRGDPAVWASLDEALSLAEASGTLQRIGPVRAARAEAAWLEGDAARAASEARQAYALALQKEHAWFAGELAYWQRKAGVRVDVRAVAAEPFALQLHGRAKDAEAAWLTLRCPYEAARARAEAGDEASLRQALGVFDRLGAAPAADDVRERLRDLGATSVPRGPRATTRANAFGLTARELEIVALIAQGLTNAAIASRLHRSEKTVDHHVSAVLAKLDVATRDAAARAAAAHGLIPK